MREIDAIAVTTDRLLDRLRTGFDIVEHAVDFDERMAFLKRPQPFPALLSGLADLGLEVVGEARLHGGPGEPRGPFNTVFVQSDLSGAP